jgi:hypothetical protein
MGEGGVGSLTTHPRVVFSSSIGAHIDHSADEAEDTRDDQHLIGDEHKQTRAVWGLMSSSSKL